MFFKQKKSLVLKVKNVVQARQQESNQKINEVYLILLYTVTANASEYNFIMTLYKFPHQNIEQFRMIGNLDKNLSIGPQVGQLQPECKKIQDYIYRFNDQIGMGNFSKVFKGVHQTNNKQVAIKIIELNSLTNNRLQQLLNTETKILKMLSHPNVIGCEEILSSIRNCYIITELCNGGDLEKKLKKVGSFKQKQIYQIVVDIYEGLKYLAKKHIVHRDIKISNIFINNGVHKIADFGFAQIAENDFKDISVGSPVYMSPEGYINNMYGPKTDVWAFGVLLYQLVEGKTPCFECRTEADLKQNLLKQIDYNRFSSGISSQLKNLIIQCLEVNPSLRISVMQIQNTAWMKKASKIASQNLRVMQKQNMKLQKVPNISHGYRKTSQQLNSKLNTPLSNMTQDPILKNYAHKLNNFLKSQQKQETEHRRKHSTLDKTVRGSKDDSLDHTNNDSGKVFYSPKNAMFKFEKGMGFKNQTPSSNIDKFESFNLKGNTSTPQNHHLKIHSNKNQISKKFYFNKDDNLVLKNKSTWMQKPILKQANDNLLRDKHMSSKEKDKSLHIYTNNNNNTEIKQEKDTKNQDLAFTQELKKVYLGSSPMNNNSFLNNYAKFTPKTDNQHSFKQKLLQTNSNKIQKIAHAMRVSTKQDSDNLKSKDLVNNVKHEKKSSQSYKIINRKLKFGDCIGLIHYCRLCYKFACLLDQAGQPDQTKNFLVSWSVQLLKQLNLKMEDCDIMFSNESCLINNFSTNVGELEKKKKLKDVTEEYLTKYSSAIKGDRNFINLKQASSFIYNLYLTKGHEFKQRAKDKKSHLYFALIGYISVLDKETRNLMEFTYEIKNSLEGRQVQKVLNIKISEFNRKIVEEITSEGNDKDQSAS